MKGEGQETVQVPLISGSLHPSPFTLHPPPKEIPGVAFDCPPAGAVRAGGHRGARMRRRSRVRAVAPAVAARDPAAAGAGRALAVEGCLAGSGNNVRIVEIGRHNGKPDIKVLAAPLFGKVNVSDVHIDSARIDFLPRRRSRVHLAAARDDPNPRLLRGERRDDSILVAFKPRPTLTRFKRTEATQLDFNTASKARPP